MKRDSRNRDFVENTMFNNNRHTRREKREFRRKDKVDVFFVDENFWLTQKAMGELFQVDRTVITKHLKNIFQRVN